MKIVVHLLGVLLVLIGAVWILQGINVLPGSFMTGEMKWALYGAIAAALGVVMLVRFGERRMMLGSVGGLLVLIGAIWFLQGIGVLPGSMMSGERRWAINGGVAILVGAGVLVFGRRRAA